MYSDVRANLHSHSFSRMTKHTPSDCKPKSPSANHLPVMTSQRLSSTWTQPTPAKPSTAGAPHPSGCPNRSDSRTAPSMFCQVSIQSSMSSLPDVDELNSSFASVLGTDEDAPQPTPPPSSSPYSALARQSGRFAPTRQVDKLEGLPWQQSVLCCRTSLPSLDEQPGASLV